MAGLVGGGDSDGNPKGRDYGLGGEAMTARAQSASPESGSVKEEAVTEKMLRAGMAAFGATELVGSSFTPRAIRSAYLAMRQADPRIAELEAALEWIAAHATKLRKGTDDWFELVEFETVARAALNRKDKP